MVDINKQVKEALDATASEVSVFSELEKQRVLSKIRSGSPTSLKKSHHFVPKLVTSLAIAGFLLFIGGVIGSNYENSNDASPSPVQGNIENFYPDLQDGEVLNGWSLLNKGAYDGAKDEPNKILHAVFQGEAKITGTLKYYGMEDPERPDEILFTPDKLSLQSLPVEKGRHPDLTFPLNEQSKLKAVFGIGTNRVDLAEVTLIVEEYTARYVKGKTLPDTARLKDIVLPVGPEVQTSPFQIQVNGENTLELSELLLDRYHQFAATHNKQVLKGLSPSDVFQLYFYAEEHKDYQTQYALFMDDEEYVKVFATYEDYLGAVEISKQQTLLKRVKEGALFENIVDETSAFVSIQEESNGFSFGFSKNKEGIWCVNWLPIQ
jgi:hypothetical protein